MSDVVHATQDWVNQQISDAVPTGGGSSPILTSPDGKRWRQIVDNDGVATLVSTLEPGPPPIPTDLTLAPSGTPTDGGS